MTEKPPQDRNRRRPDDGEPVRLERSGIPASPGIAIGPAFVVDRRRVHVPRTEIDRDSVDAEAERFRAAIRTTQEQLETIKARMPHGEHRQILKAQQMMLRDPDLLNQTEALIREEFINAEWALARVMDEVLAVLDQADDAYFRERSSDVAFLGERVILNLQGDHPGELQPPPGCIVVAHDLSPADTAHLARGQVLGLLTGAGTQTSHTAIVARSFEIPAVVGVDNIIGDVRSGDMLILDASQGEVVVRPTEAELVEWGSERDKYEAFEDRIQREHALPATTQDGARVVLRANVGLDEEVASARFHGAEGIGLYRTEFTFMNREDRPSEEEHYRRAKGVLRKMAPYPVIFRTFDLGADKTSGLVSFQEKEANPAMGLRSMRLALRERDLFLDQLRGLLRAGLHGPLRIMLPLIGGLEELRAGLEAVEEAKAQLEQAHMPFEADVPIGIMIEMPSAAIVSDLLVQHVDFVSIGTNDLIQYTLAIDRENEHVGYLYQPLHPAIIRLIRRITEAAMAHDVPVSLCGEMAADPYFTWVLVGLGVTELSMHPSAVPVIKNIIRGSASEEMQALAGRVLEAPDAETAEAIVRETMASRFSEHLRHGGHRLESGPSPSASDTP